MPTAVGHRRPAPAGRSPPTERWRPTTMRRPSPPAAPAAIPIAARDDDPADAAGPGPPSAPGTDGSTPRPITPRRQPPSPAARRTGKMQTRAWVISLVVGGVENLRPPHGPCPPSSAQLSPRSNDFDATLIRPEHEPAYAEHSTRRK